MKFSIKDFFSKCDQIHSFLRIWSHLLMKSLMEHFIFAQWTFVSWRVVDWRSDQKDTSLPGHKCLSIFVDQEILLTIFIYLCAAYIPN